MLFRHERNTDQSFAFISQGNGRKSLHKLTQTHFSSLSFRPNAWFDLQQVIVMTFRYLHSLRWLRFSTLIPKKVAHVLDLFLQLFDNDVMQSKLNWVFLGEKMLWFRASSCLRSNFLLELDPSGEALPFCYALLCLSISGCSSLPSFKPER